MKDNNEVARVLKDTKKLNESSRNTRERIAVIALMALKDFHESGLFPEKHNSILVELSERLLKTSLCKSPEDTGDDEVLEQTFNLIEEYLKEQGV